MGGFRRFCTGCGHELRQEGRFCTVCGQAAAEPTVPSSGPGRAPPAGLSAAETITRGRLEGPFAHPAPGPPPGPPPWQPDLAPPRGDAPRGYDAPPGYDVHPGYDAPPGYDPPPGYDAHPGYDGPVAEPRRRRFPWLLGAGLAVLLVGGAATAAVLVLHHHASSATDTGGASQHAAKQSSAGSSTTPSPSKPPQQQAADSLSALLAQSVTDRSSIVNAVTDVSECGPSLGQDAQTFQNAATSRQTLLSQLADMPDRSALPAPMFQALTSAWQASIQADQDFAQWAQDEASRGCVPNDHSDPGYQAAAGPDGRATTDKKAFVSSWNPIAAQYGLTPYQWNQL
jgi:hypothetical protein